MAIIDSELCEEGSRLWEDIFDGCSVFDNLNIEKYDKYLSHIKSCKECLRRLGISSVISEEELSEEI